MRTLALVILLSSAAYAGGPVPSEYIPWDSVLFVDTLQSDDEVFIDEYWVHYIVREKYEIEVLGIANAPILNNAIDRLDKIEALLKKRRKKK